MFLVCFWMNVTCSEATRSSIFLVWSTSPFISFFICSIFFQNTAEAFIPGEFGHFLTSGDRWLNLLLAVVVLCYLSLAFQMKKIKLAFNLVWGTLSTRPHITLPSLKPFNTWSSSVWLFSASSNKLWVLCWASTQVGLTKASHVKHQLLTTRIK